MDNSRWVRTWVLDNVEGSDYVGVTYNEDMRCYDISLGQGVILQWSDYESRLSFKRRLAQYMSKASRDLEPVDMRAEPFNTASPGSRAQEVRHKLAALSEPRACASKLDKVPGVMPKLTIYCEGDDW